MLYICYNKGGNLASWLERKKMKKLTNNSNDYAIIVNKGSEGFTVHFGYTVSGEDTCTNRKTYKSEKMAVKNANKYLGL